MHGLGHSLTMQKLLDSSVAVLMHKAELLNSQNKFNINSSLATHISRTFITSGGGKKRKHVHMKRKENDLLVP